MPDQFQSHADQVSAPARRVVAVTPHDSNPLGDVAKALYVGTAGHVALRAIDSSTDAVFKNVPAGTVLPVRASHVRATGTSAAALVALF